MGTPLVTTALLNVSSLNGFDGPRGDHSGWWVLFPIGMMLFWGAVILTIVFMVTRRRGGGPWRGPGGPGGPGPWNGGGSESSLERAQGILAERLARGEIDGSEYRERLSHLTSHTP